jgi:DHA1 family multidrug resistance protein-like MFS transporter
MGFYTSMNSFGGIFGALFAGLIYAKGAMLPFVLAFIAFLVSTLLAVYYQKLYKKEKTAQ